MRHKHNSIVASVNLTLIRLPRSALCKYSSASHNEQESELSKEAEEDVDNPGRST
jgi:hypothetical protein